MNLQPKQHLDQLTRVPNTQTSVAIGRIYALHAGDAAQQ